MNWPTTCPSVRESLLRDSSTIPPEVDWIVNALPDPAEIFGAAVPIPTFPLAPSMEKIGGLPTAVVVPILHAFTNAGIVLVADFWNASVSEEADDEANVITFESR